MTHTLLFLTIVLFVPTLAQPANSCNCVAFRLDDIQDFFCGYAQRTVMDIFKDFSFPLTFGVIGGKIGSDVNNLMYLTNAVNNQTWGLEVANHGLNHEDFTQFTLDQQINLLNQSNSVIQNLLGRKCTTFMPPFNLLNDNTRTALKQLGFQVLSSSMGLDPPPYDFVQPDLWRFPIFASTSIERDWTYYYADTADNVFNAITSQINTFGYAAVMMHPQEFSAWTGSTYDSTQLNDTAIAMLKDVLQRVKAAGLKVTTLGGLKTAFSGQPISSIPTQTQTAQVTVSATAQSFATQTGLATSKAVASEPAQSTQNPIHSGAAQAISQKYFVAMLAVAALFQLIQ